MARSIRIEFPGACYHVMARGNRRENIFHGDDDRRFFLRAVGEACAMTGWRVQAWVLMSNHYHLFLEPGGGNAMAAECPYPSIQFAPSAVGAALWRSVQVGGALPGAEVNLSARRAGLRE